jgi:two-component system response regulator LytT
LSARSPFSVSKPSNLCPLTPFKKLGLPLPSVIFVNCLKLVLTIMDEKIRILIVEDEETWMISLRSLLTSLGFEVAATAESLEKAIQVINTTEFDIALLDISMGETTSGISLGQLIRGTLKKPFVFITASHASHTLNEAAAAKPSAYLLKPVDKNSLYIAIQSALENFIDKKELPKLDEGYNSQSFFTKRGKKYVKVYWSDVLSLTSEQKYTVLELVNDKTCCYLRSSLQNTIHHILPANYAKDYAQINRGQFINKQHVLELIGTSIIMSNDKEYDVSDNYLPELKKQMNIMH